MLNTEYTESTEKPKRKSFSPIFSVPSLISPCVKAFFFDRSSISAMWPTEKRISPTTPIVRFIPKNQVVNARVAPCRTFALEPAALDPEKNDILQYIVIWQSSEVLVLPRKQIETSLGGLP